MRRYVSLALTLFLFGVVITSGQAPPPPTKPLLVLDTDGHNDIVRRVIFTPNGKHLVTVSMDKTVRVWNADSGEPIKSFHLPIGPGDEGSLISAAVSPDNRWVTVSGIPPNRGKTGFFVYVVSLTTGLMSKTIKTHENVVTSLTYSKDGKRFASASADKTAQVYDAQTFKVISTLKGHTDVVRQIAFAPDGKKAVTVSSDKSARIWVLPAGRSEATLTSENRNPLCVAWSPDGKTIATGNTDGTIVVWDPAGKSRKVIPDLKTQIVSLTFSADSKEVLYTGTAITAGQGEFPAGMVDIESGKERIRFTSHNDSVFCGALSPDGKLAATSGGDNNETYVWNTENGKTAYTLVGKGQTPGLVAWAPDGKAIAWGTKDKPLSRSFKFEEMEFGGPANADFRRADVTQGDWTLEKDAKGQLIAKEKDKVISTIELESAKERIYTYTWLKDGRAAVGTNSKLYLVDPKANRIVRKFVGHPSHIFSVAPSPDGRFFLTGGGDQTIRLWDPEKEEPLLSFFFTDKDWICWMADGTYAASADGDHFIGWVTPKNLNEMPLYSPATRFRSTLMHPDVIKEVIKTGNINKAYAALGKKPSGGGGIASILPPQIQITAPMPPTGGGPITMDEKAEFEVTATAKSLSNYSLQSVRLLVDGRPYKGQVGVQRISPPRVGPITVSWKVEALGPGNHTIAVQAVTANNSRAISPYLDINCGGKEPGAPNLYVLSMGINEYPAGMKLRFCTPDATALPKAFEAKSKALFGKVETKILLDKQATRKGIMDGLAWLGTQMTTRDVAIVFFSGHGHTDKAGNQFLIPADINPAALNSTMLPGTQFKNALGELPGKVICMMDCCFSGGLTDNKKRNQFEEMIRDLVSEDYGVICLCSSTGSEVSIEASNVGHGFFTAALLEGLAGKADLNGDGTIFLNELESFASKRVKELSRGTQNPIFAKPPNVQWFPLATTK